MMGRGAATLAACLLILQIVLAGFATAAVSSGDLSGAACASPSTQSVDPLPENGQPAPESSHQHGACCILHGGVLAMPETKSAVAHPVIYPEEIAKVSPAYRIDAAGADPELRPLSPRAPPARLV